MVMKSMGFGSSLSTNIIPLQSFVGDPISNRGFHPRKKKKRSNKTGYHQSRRGYAYQKLGYFRMKGITLNIEE